MSIIVEHRKVKNFILAITPNPALDVCGFVDRIVPNEKSYVFDEVRAPGGNAVNVARILNRLKVPVLASGFLGGSTGSEVENLLKNEGIRQQFIETTSPTRINITVSNRKDHNQTRLSFPGPSINLKEKNRLLKLVRRSPRGGILVIGGSLPPNFSVQDLKQIIQVAKNRDKEVVVDCPGQILQQLTKCPLLLIKPNLEEFQVMTRSRMKTISEVKKKAIPLLRTVSYICISSVDRGTLLVTQSGCFFGRIPQMKIRSTVGAGDSMVGAMVAQLSTGNFSAPEILRWGLAAAAATLGETGTTLGSAAQIKKLYKKIAVVEVW